MKRLLLPLGCWFVFAVCAFAQQTGPILADGNFAAAAEPAPLPSSESMRAKDGLANGFLDIFDAFHESKENPKAYNKVIATAQNLLGKGVEDPRLYVYMAIAYEGLKDYDNALFYANEAIAKRPSAAEAYVTRANVYYQRGDSYRANDDLQTALQLNPKSSRALSFSEAMYEDGLKGTVPKKTRKPGTSSKNLPAWFFVYVLCVILVLAAFLIMRYRNLVRGIAGERGRKVREVNIKEQFNFIRQIGEGGMG
ncbi:MAG: tetratricopeptide repeat protein, partial [Elusimicrobiota bacterium]|nr:tetratricopeptide repeat protein [Elusimicrobiota bacterium]